MKNTKLIIIITSLIVLAFLTIKFLNYQVTKKILEYVNLKGEYVNKIPINLTVTEPAIKDSTINFNIYNIKLTIPRTDTLLVKRIDNVSLFFKFDNNATLSVIRDTSDFNLINALNKNDNFDYNTLKYELQKAGIESNYDFLNFIFNKTSRDLNFFASKKRVTLEAAYIKLKTINEVRGCEKAWYRFNLHHIKGFQYCEPGACEETFIQYFTPSDDEYMIISKGMLQIELDYILVSIDDYYNISDNTNK